MFVEFTTKKKEKFVVNVQHIVLICQSKNGLTVKTDDDYVYDCIDDYFEFVAKLLEKFMF